MNFSVLDGMELGRKITGRKPRKGRKSISKGRSSGKKVENDLVEEMNVEETVVELEEEESEKVKRSSGKKGRGKKIVVMEEDMEEEWEAEPEEDIPEIIDEEPKEGEDVWEAVVWDDVSPSSDPGPVFDEKSIEKILKDVVDQAWTDGVITNDEMAMLRILKERLNIDDGTFDRIMSESKPPMPEIDELEDPLDPGELPVPELLDEVVDDEDDEEEIELDTDLMTSIGPPPKMPSDLPQPPPIPDTFVQPISQTMPGPVHIKQPIPDQQPEPRPATADTRNIITLTSHVRDNKKPLGESFDLTKREDPSEAFKRRCPHCRAMIRVRPEEGKDICPICGGKVVNEKVETPGLRRLLNQGKLAFKQGDVNAANDLYTMVLSQSPQNKEAQFYIQKLQHQMGEKKAVLRGDARNVSFVQSSITRLDQLLHGGIPSGSQVLLKGPAFCGKEVVFDKIMASSLSLGIPVIYVSSNRAMKEVMQGIFKQIPDFRKYNQEGLVRMYDLFSKHSDGRILKEGHRIFNIEDREDFKRFQSDLVFLMEELVQQYHGGVLLINSLSPLITQADLNDLMKFLQVMIARSKSYRFTNLLDMAAGVHPESVENSIEYLMDGIIEFKERDNKKTLRLKGFRHGVLSHDWVEYKHNDSDLQLVGSFQEERIL